MSIASDVRSYADSALEQGKQVVDQAQSRLGEVQDNAQDFASKAASKASSKASETYADLRTRGEELYERVSTLPVVERATAVAEPYVSQVSAQLNGYRTTVTDKVEQLYTDLKKNDQVAKVLSVAETAAGVVIETVNERVVNPVKSLLEREPVTDSKPTTAKTPATPAAPAAEASAKPAAPAKAPAKKKKK
jgi:hypothetical protein